MNDDLCGLRVLIIDDEKDFASTLASRLELREMRVTCAFCGEEGLARIREEPPDVVLLDMRMPGLSGVDVLERIRMHHPLLPVIIVSGHCTQQDSDLAEELGIQGFHAKPLQFRELMATFMELARKIRTCSL